MMDFARKLMKDETGATAIEYGLIAALIAIGIIGALTTLSGELEGTFNEVGNELSNSTSSSGDST
jgi:pilus assembly protein Flp/PilA